MRATRELARELAEDFVNCRSRVENAIAVCEEVARHDGPELTIGQGEVLCEWIKAEWRRMDGAPKEHVC